MLFNHLPEELFAPLAGTNKAVYQAVLMELADLFFDEDAVDPFVPRDLVRSAIEEAVIKYGLRQWAPESESDQEPPRSTADFAARIYRRLLQTGWLEEETKLFRTYVLMAPAISYVLRALVGVARQQKRSYGGTILNVLSSVEAAIADPEGRGLTLAEAARTAADFSAHLTDMLLGLRELRRAIASTNDPQRILRGFFEEFVERILVADYKTLKTQNNPFRFRRQILALLKDLQFDPPKLAALAHHYQDQLDLSYVEAQNRVHQHISRILRIFESIDQRLQIIDEFRFRLEKRVADTVRYMDKTTPGMAARLQRLISAVAQLPEERIPCVDTLDQPAFIAPRSIRVPPKRRPPPAPRVIQQVQIDPEVLALRERFKAYKARREVSAEKVDFYLQEQLLGRRQLQANEFSINSIEDFICFSYVRHLAALGKTGKGLAANYRIQFKDSYVTVAGMVECRDFQIERID
ncbi:Wadjet anti-phage system protein JetA family protein [Balneatrix alpica]|uniref:Wadjet anti-phage system protein JetA family protein n=1 Tax=Balneatrix alpica TaxID=75684 RepID=UPI0027384B1E|nr:Wadjet anti-phage system protein JetA family protein [Balneatrix alpica]